MAEKGQRIFSPVPHPTQAEPGDILFTAHRGSLVNAVIQWVTDAEVTHCGLVIDVETDETGRTVVMHTHEALPDGLLPRIRRESTEWAIDGKRPPTLIELLRPPQEAVEAIIAKSKEMTPAKYNWVGVIRLGCTRIAQKLWRILKRTPPCWCGMRLRTSRCSDRCEHPASIRNRNRGRLPSRMVDTHNSNPNETESWSR